MRKVIVFAVSSIEYVPKLEMTPSTVDWCSAAVPFNRLFDTYFGRSERMIWVRKAAVVGEDEEALGIRAPSGAAVRSLAGRRDEGPSPDDLLLKRFMLTEGTARQQGQG